MAIVKNPEIRQALANCKGHFVAATLYSLVSNILLLAFPLFIINVFSRAVTSRSFETLLVLFIGFAIAIFFRMVFHWLRSALLIRSGVRLDRLLAKRVVECLFERRAAGQTDIGSQALRDLDSCRQYVAGTGGGAVIDVPLGGLFLGVLLIMSVPMALVAVGAIVVITILTIIEVLVTRSGINRSDREALNSYGFLEANLPSAEAVMGMGMLQGLLAKWQAVRDLALSAQGVASYRGKGFDEAIGAIRYIALGIFICVGAIQIIEGVLPSGVMIGAIFIFRYAMNPFAQLVQAWAAYFPVKAALLRLERVLETSRPQAERMRLPRPAGELAVRQISYAAPGDGRPVLRNMSFGLRAGVSLGVIGLIGAGKTSLARILVGAIKPRTGSVSLDGNELWGWVRADGGQYVGYVPQNVSLLRATVAENISRFGMFDEKEVIAAAEMAGAHNLILQLPLGYDTVIGDGAYPLSGGQKQLIALARAVVGIPPLVILDEPNSNLDGPGEDALMRCINRLRELQSTVVLISHRPQLVRELDKILLLRNGELVRFGDTDDVLQQLGRPVIVRRGGADRQEQLSGT